MRREATVAEPRLDFRVGQLGQGWLVSIRGLRSGLPARREHRHSPLGRDGEDFIGRATHLGPGEQSVHLEAQLEATFVRLQAAHSVQLTASLRLAQLKALPSGMVAVPGGALQGVHA